jgi:hypothetical protein
LRSYGINEVPGLIQNYVGSREIVSRPAPPGSAVRVLLVVPDMAVKPRRP